MRTENATMTRSQSEGRPQPTTPTSDTTRWGGSFSPMRDPYAPRPDQQPTPVRPA